MTAVECYANKTQLDERPEHQPDATRCVVRSSRHCGHPASSVRRVGPSHPLSTNFDVHYWGRHHHRVFTLRLSTRQRKLLAMDLHPDGKITVSSQWKPY